MIPGKYNIIIYKRSDWSQAVVFEDSSGSAIDLSLYQGDNGSIKCEFWNVDRTTKHVDVTVEVTNASTGSLTLRLNDTQTSTLPELSYYDLKLTSGAISNYWMYGSVNAKEGYTT